jgi:hypothetical protein
MMKLRILILILAFASCKKVMHCDNATIFKSSKCGVEWEADFQGERYPVDSLPAALRINNLKIHIEDYHFYSDPQLCICCGYKWLIVENASSGIFCN